MTITYQRDNHAHAYDEWYSDGDRGNPPKFGKPKGVERLGWAAPEEDRDEEVVGARAYKAFLFKSKDKVILAIGCRRFTLGEAYAHWQGVSSVSPARDDVDQARRRRRAYYIMEYVIPRAERRARKLGWKI